MHTVVLSRLLFCQAYIAGFRAPGMNRSNQTLGKKSHPLSLLLGVLLSVASVCAQESKQGIPEGTTAPGISSRPDNLEEDQGLLAVQQQMVSRALEYARELDFESAERILCPRPRRAMPRCRRGNAKVTAEDEGASRRNPCRDS